MRKRHNKLNGGFDERQSQIETKFDDKVKEIMKGRHAFDDIRLRGRPERRGRVTTTPSTEQRMPLN